MNKVGEKWERNALTNIVTWYSYIQIEKINKYEYEIQIQIQTQSGTC